MSRAMSSRMEANFQYLLPGIPNEITMSTISTKLSWRDFYVLALVSRDWCHAIRRRQVYDARVLHRTTDTLVLFNYALKNRSNLIALYSMRDNSCCALPPIPGINGGFPFRCQAVASDGKIYVLGGVVSYHFISSGVYVLDLVGQRQWKRCPNMTRPRRNFECGVMDGKIYAFGGFGFSRYEGDDHIGGSEVYDPKENIWSKITPLPTPPCARQAVIAVKEFLVAEMVQDGGFVYPTYELWNIQEFSEFLDGYIPAKDEWRKLPCSRTGCGAVLFMAQGKLHEIHLNPESSIQVHNTDENSWTRVHTFTFVSNEPVDSTNWPLPVLFFRTSRCDIARKLSSYWLVATGLLCIMRSAIFSLVLVLSIVAVCLVMAYVL
ncbi:unnamed protein product [Calypogeia fissa]